VKRRRDLRRRARPPRRRIAGLALLFLVASVAAYAFTASLTVTQSNAGDGAGTVSSASVTSMQFQYDSNTPTLIADVVVSFSASVTSAKAKFTAGSWSNACTGSGSGPWACVWSGGTAVPTSGQTLRVVAAS